MRVLIHKTMMLDGETVTDVDVMTNTIKSETVTPRAIFTCHTEADAKAFADGLKKLADKHTCGMVDIIDDLDEEGA